MKAGSIKLDGRFFKQVKGRVEGHSFEVGILQDGPHKRPQSKTKGLTSLAGGPTRKKGRKPSGVTISEVSEDIRKRMNINFYQRPFKMKSNREILRFSNAFLKSIMTPSGNMKEKKRLENLLQAIVRNPITRGDYGINTIKTASAKGFNRLMIDTGQLFKAITAKVKKNRV
jgi:hypothetical protein